MDKQQLSNIPGLVENIPGSLVEAMRVLSGMKGETNKLEKMLDIKVRAVSVKEKEEVNMLG